MRSAVFLGAGRPLQIQQRDVPEPAAGQALIRVQRCGICGSDLSMTSGSAYDVPAGTALGHEYAGEVVALGPGENRLRLGDRVTALPMSSCGHCAYCGGDTPLHCGDLVSMAGGYGEYTLIDQRVAFRLPDALSFADGALAEPLACGLRGVRKLGLARGARVAVFGAGAIGAGAVFWARRAGAGRVVAIARSERAAELVRTVGADTLVSGGERLAERVAEALGGPPDAVVEAAGASGLLQQAIDLVAIGGSVLSLGGCIRPDPIVPMLGMVKEVRIQFSVAYGAGDFSEVLEVLASGATAARAMIGETIGLDALPGRFEALRRGGHPAKVMVAPWQA